MPRMRLHKVVRLAVVVGAAGLIPGLAEPGVTERISVNDAGIPAVGSSGVVSLNADGRYAVFQSIAPNLVFGDINFSEDIFVRDRVAGTTERVSVATDGTQGFGPSFNGAVSADGRLVVFDSDAPNLVPGDTNAASDVFVHDRISRVTTRVSVSSSGEQGELLEDSYNVNASLSADGRYVVFQSTASNLVAGDTNSASDVFVHDLDTGSTSRVSIRTDGGQATGGSGLPTISDDGTVIGFLSDATNLAPGDTNGLRDVFLHHRLTGVTTRVNVSSSGVQANAFTGNYVDLSADGRHVVFSSAASLVPDDTNGVSDAFIRDTFTGVTTLISRTPAGRPGNLASVAPAIDAAGIRVIFTSAATDLVPGDTNFASDIFLVELASGRVTRESVASDGSQADCRSGDPTISADGRFAGFESLATNLVADDIGHTVPNPGCVVGMVRGFAAYVHALPVG